MTHQFIVKAKENSITGGQLFKTGIQVQPGDLIVATCSPSDTWSAGGGAKLTSNANGLGNPIGHDYGLGNLQGAQFIYGSLVGTLDDGDNFFGVGTNLTMTVLTKGELAFTYWDQNNGDNSGEITVTVQVYNGPNS